MKKETLGSRLRKLRLRERLEQKQVAELVGVDRSAISYYENDTRQPPYDTLVRLALLYKVSTDYLLGKEKVKIDFSNLTGSDMMLVEDVIRSLSDKNAKMTAYAKKLGVEPEE